jgi:antirestriction protein ArdC
MVTFWKLLDHKDKETGEKGKLPLLRYYTVFNIEQTEGIKLRRTTTHPPRTVEPIAACEAILNELPASSARRINGGGIACYVPDRDEIHVPGQAAFHSDAEYYGTLFHELVHSTGHESRLSREGIVDRVRFASHAYSREELIAEMGAAFLAGETGIAPATLDNSVAYLQNWVRVLKGDARLVVQAAGAAQKAVDWLRGRQAINTEEECKTPSTDS